MLAESRKLMKRSEAFGEEQRVTGAAAAATPDGDVLLFIIGPPIEAPAAAPADEPATPASAVAAPAISNRGRPARFTFSLDSDQQFTAVSPELQAAVGDEAADVIGCSWSETAERFGLDEDGVIAGALARRDTWSGVTVAWPTASDDKRVPVELTAIPSFSRNGSFEGFRGFGVIRADGPDAAEPESGGGETASEPEAQPSNVVRLPSAERTEPEASQLSGDEQDAFRRIAEALRSVGRKASAHAAAAEPEVLPIAAPPPPSSIPLRLLDRVPVGIVVFREGAVLFANRAFLDRLGYSDVASLAAAGGIDAMFAEAGPPEPDEHEAAYRIPLRAADGRQLSAEARLHVVPWVDGPATMLSVRDPTPLQGERRLADEQAAMARIDELEAVLDTATDGALVLDGMGRILSLNRSAEALFGIEATDVLGLPFTDLLAEESRKSASDYLDGLARNGVASVLNDGREVIGRVPAGGLIPLFMTMGRLSERGKFCAVLRDITHWKNVEEELVAARHAAEVANHQKSEFLAKISHEIRTPLNAIIGFSDVIIEERFGPIGVDRYREYLKDIRLSGTHLMSLINDLLDLSKIESGKLDLNFAAVAVNQIVQECVALMQPEANRRRVIIRTSLADDVPRVVADERALRQIVLNLLSNAVKFNVAGGQVIVSTALDENGEVVLRIRDTGIGMSEKEIETAMKPFQQIATAGAARFEGTGLGLPLTKALVEANRAAFLIDSTPNQGTLVRINFPIERVLQS
jgi:PAS domain S-box-containing protein